MDLIWLAAYLLLGAVTGVLAGLFGIGGGGVMVPLLTLLFIAQGFPEATLVHLALGTSMAAIVPTAAASVLAHQGHGSVDWPAVRGLTPGVLLGTFAGTFLAARLPAQPLAVFFVIFMSCVAVQMLLDRKPRPARALPGRAGLVSVGTGIGGVSSLVAIGGGTMTVPFLLWCNRSMPQAVGSSAAVGLPIALAGAAGYALNGWGQSGLPAYTLGFVYWPAVLAMAAASLVTTPLGASLAHRLPVTWLKRLFALLLIGLALQMLRSLW